MLDDLVGILVSEYPPVGLSGISSWLPWVQCLSVRLRLLFLACVAIVGWL